MNNTTFSEALLTAALSAIAEYKADGTVAVSRQTMFARLSTRLSNHPKSPKGTNARYYFHQALDEMIAKNKKVKAFILDPRQ